MDLTKHTLLSVSLSLSHTHTQTFSLMNEINKTTVWRNLEPMRDWNRTISEREWGRTRLNSLSHTKTHTQKHTHTHTNTHTNTAGRTCREKALSAGMGMRAAMKNAVTLLMEVRATLAPVLFRHSPVRSWQETREADKSKSTETRLFWSDCSRRRTCNTRDGVQSSQHWCDWQWLQRFFFWFFLKALKCSHPAGPVYFCLKNRKRTW